MYRWIWLRLPGSPIIRTAELTLVLFAVAALLWLVAFPWLSLHLPVDPAGMG